MNTESAPQAETVEYLFPARESMPKVKMPEVKVHWYDGGILPSRPDLLQEGEDLMDDGMGGCMFIGSTDSLIWDVVDLMLVYYRVEYLKLSST